MHEKLNIILFGIRKEVKKDPTEEIPNELNEIIFTR